MANTITRRRTSRSRSKSFGSYGRSSGSGATRRTGGRTVNYTAVRNKLQNKINAFRCLYTQTQASGPWRPTPATINKFANWVNKGAVIHKVNGTKIAKWCKDKHPTYTPNWAMKGLKTKFGAAIKGVFPTGNGKTYFVATSPTWKGKPFKFPTY